MDETPISRRYQLMLHAYSMIGAVLGMTVVLTLSQLSPVPTQAQAPPPNVEPAAALPPTRYSAWFAWWNEPQALESLDRAASQLDTVSPVWYTLSSAGKLVERSVTAIPDVTRIASASGVLLMPSVANDFKNDPVQTLITSDPLTDAFISELLSTAATHGYDGYDFDLEEVKPENGADLQEFLTKVAAALHRNNLRISVTVHARTGAADDWIMAKTYDWQALSQIADEIRIMAYDFHNEGTDPGPVTPLTTLSQVVQYALRTIPRNKIVIGLPDYGYDWSADANKSVAYETAAASVTRYDGTWHRDPASGELVGTYTENGNVHTIYVADAESIRRKVDTVRQYQLNAFCIWRLGEEDPAVWTGVLRR